MSNASLKSFIDRIETLEEEKKAIGTDIRDVYDQAKGAGYTPKIMRRLVRERQRDAAEVAEEEALLDAYRHALGMAVSLVRDDGLSLREAEKATGISKSSIHRALAVPAVSQTKAGDVSPIVSGTIAAAIGASQPHTLTDDEPIDLTIPAHLRRTA